MSGETTPRKAAATKAAAARTEKTTEPRVVHFRGVSLTLPPVLPGSLYFDVADLQEDESPAMVLRILRSLIGGDQVTAVREKIVEDAVPYADVQVILLELFNAVLGAYGTDLGESEASAES